MNAEENALSGPALDPELVADLRLRLRAAQVQETALRGHAHRLTRELAVAQRLLRFYVDAPPPPTRSIRTQELQRTHARLLTQDIRFHLDACRDHGAYTTISGWAFRPAPAWNGKTTVISLLLRDGTAVYTVGTSPVPRQDVAAYFAGQPPDATGGAVSLEGVGFACEIFNESLPAGREWEIVLHLECEGTECEQSTGQFLHV